MSPTFFIVLFGLGFVVAASGHLFRSRTLIAAGILMVFLATVLIPLAFRLFN